MEGSIEGSSGIWLGWEAMVAFTFAWVGLGDTK